jgi:transcriptional regulator with XRE-family HTH domain
MDAGEHVVVAGGGAGGAPPRGRRQRTGPYRRRTPRPLPAGAVPLAEKLNHLFRAVRAPDGGEYSLDDVAEAIRGRDGPPISAAYLSLLRRGKRDNPTKEHIAALADFFGVSVTYFFDEPAAARFDRELDLLVSLRDPLVRRVAVAAQGLSRESLEAVLAIVQHARRVERLPPPPGGAAGNEPQ